MGETNGRLAGRKVAPIRPVETARMVAEPQFLCPDVHGLRVTVMGLGRFGGGVGAVNFLLKRGAKVTLTDLLPADELADPLAQVESAALAKLRLGGHDEADFREADVVVVNPAVPRSHPLLQVARNAGAALTSEMSLFWQCRKGPVVGVTGSNGKSTTAALIHSILNAAGWNAHLGGNIGGSLLPLVDEIRRCEWSVLELSSFQLHDLDRLPSSPEVAVVTNFTPNHLDWHGDVEEYRRAKQAILRWQPPDGVCVLNADDPEVSTWCHHGWCYFFGRNDAGAPGVYLRRVRPGECDPNSPQSEGESLLIRSKSGEETAIPVWTGLRLPGKHNLQNATAAAATALALDVPLAAIERGLQNFEPLPHRLQFVGEWEGRRFYNDSLATTPESTIAALNAFAEPIVLLAGGSDKGIDLSGMAMQIASKTKAVALMGETAEQLGMLIEGERLSNGPATRECDDFDEAFCWAARQSAPGDVVLLSPGCASYDWFRNFADRGDRFTRLVEKQQQAEIGDRSVSSRR